MTTIVCEDCDTKLRWLYYPTKDRLFPEKDNMTQTDFLICSVCDKVYIQWIESTVHRDKYKPILVGSKQ